MGGGLLHFLQVALGVILPFGAVALGLFLNPASWVGLLWLRSALLLAAGSWPSLSSYPRPGDREGESVHDHFCFKCNCCSCSVE